MIQAQFNKDFAGWREVARQFMLNGIEPANIHWDQEAPSLFTDPLPEVSAGAADGGMDSGRPKRALTVPADFFPLAEAVACARDDERWALLYRLLFRLQHENSNLLKIAVDPDVNRAQLLFKSVRRDIHKMHAFVRFKKTILNGEELYLAWHRPEHLIVKAATPFFERRFGDRRWSIFTPDESAHWDLQALTFGPGMEQNQFMAQDAWDEVWKTYYKSIFNPARIKIKAMKLEMATKYWSSLPESSLIAELVREAPKRLQSMAANHNRSAQVDAQLPLAELRERARTCTACPLYSRATQTVFGIGPENAEIMIVGEQPGDQEDLAGLPFIGPAGEILEGALAAAGLDRGSVYLTNAVKHFKWSEQRGKTRLHQKPSGNETHACKPWLEAEIAKVKPKVIVALGATAGTAILGRLPKITSERGQIRRGLKIAPSVIVSWHPAAILRASSPQEANERRGQLAEDLRLAMQALGR